VIWRAAIGAVYIGLAIVVGVAYGWHGLLVLSFLYVSSAAWFVFIVVWGRLAHTAGRWNAERLDQRRR
jgi:hypothetical protein